ncbi:adenylate kinase [Micractinium conductrix]|uniref:adenylate kinase n=1 Tax=Micractinium conductrix TaxID=554055 RepID=A0A2P6V450_9CHLO|nr:adenylate kinase [Micractinium conductrix]|eukprot:PSC68866.1 adenylate kinase [Micractinium conductrix]
MRGGRWAQTMTVAQQTAAPPRGGFVPVPASPLRPLHASKERLSLKAQVIFESSWKKIEEKYKDRLMCPREVVWLNGAPGSGKGTNMPFIMKSRGLSRAIGMSQLLDTSPDIKNIIDRGELVPDHMVLDALLEVILNPETNDGAGLVIDGFPRTALQVDFVKLLHDKLGVMSLRHADTPDEWRFPRPSFKVVILYVDEEESVRRQMRRAQLAAMHNKRVMDAGTGDVWDVRTTDVNEALCRRRYQVFKAHYHTILRLKSFFPFSLIDAMGTLEEARQQIMRELRYQSSLDLDEKTYAAIRHLPLARDLVRVARQRLVFRLDSYCKRDNKLFSDVIKLIDAEVLPVLKQSSLAGAAEYRTQSTLLSGSPHAVDILIDVLSDRGFSVAHTLEERLVPQQVDLQTGDITCRPDPIHIFRVTFDKENVRDLSTPISVTTKQGEDIAIGSTHIPQHMLREEGKRMAEAMPWSPSPAKKAAPEGGAPLANGISGGGGYTPAALTSRSSAGSSLSRTSTPVEQRRQAAAAGRATATAALSGVAAAAHGAAAAAAEGYTLASASAGSARRISAEQDPEGTDADAHFLRGWCSADPELAAANRQREYGFLDMYRALEELNDRED